MVSFELVYYKFDEENMVFTTEYKSQRSLYELIKITEFCRENNIQFTVNEDDEIFIQETRERVCNTY